MSTPRPYTLTLAAARSLTVLEIARASVLSGAPPADSDRLLRAWLDPTGNPADMERAALMLYAWAYLFERRSDPALTWEEVQTWALTFDVTADPVADAEAVAAVEAAVATGLPPDVAGQLTVAQTEAYIAKGRELAAARGR